MIFKQSSTTETTLLNLCQDAVLLWMQCMWSMGTYIYILQKQNLNPKRQQKRIARGSSKQEVIRPEELASGCAEEV